MDDLVRTGLWLIVGFVAAAVLALVCLALLVIRELDAWAVGDTGFILWSIGIVLLLIAGYIGTGLWLRRVGRI